MRNQNNKITIIELENRVDLSLELYNYVVSDIKHPPAYNMTVNDICIMYGDSLNTWLYYQAQLIDNEHYLICEKVKTLLDYEYNDCKAMLYELGEQFPDKKLRTIQRHF